jgi:hypothetical protein
MTAKYGPREFCYIHAHNDVIENVTNCVMANGKMKGKRRRKNQ